MTDDSRQISFSGMDRVYYPEQFSKLFQQESFTFKQSKWPVTTRCKAFYQNHCQPYKAIILLLLCLFTTACTYAQTDSITLAVRPAYDSVTSLHRFFLGENYRKLWATPVTMRVLSLTKEKGGLTIIKQGGGLQTRSLRLKDASGKEWVLRSLEKYPDRVLPPNLKESVVRDILVDQITTSNPFAALTVPPFATALDIPRASPEVVYVKDDPALGEYRNDYGNKVFLFEEREGEGNLDSDNTDKVKEKLKEDNDVFVDQQIVLRARLLDLLLGDWDRHNDQWRWQQDKKKKQTVYTPIPRDRDQVYYKTSGVFPWIVSHQFLMSKFQPYHETIRDIKGWNVNARFFDRFFLNSLNEEQWKEQIAYVQAHITDSLINASMRLMPAPIYVLTGENTARIMKARRNNLSKLALDYYRFVNKVVDITTSDKHELFDIQHLEDGKVSITIYKVKKDGEKDNAIFERTFEPQVTKEIRLYAYGNTDAFVVTGNQRSPIKIRMIGGDDVDSFAVAADNPNKRKLYIYDRKDQQNNIPPGIRAKPRLGKDSVVNSYDPHNFQYDMFGPVFSADYNSDDAIIAKVGLQWVKHGFRKEPYASKQELWVHYSTGRSFFRITYDGDFKKVFGNNDIVVSAYSRGPRYIRNFFGIGNESAFPNKDERKISFYRTRFDLITADVRARHPLSKNLSLTAGVNLQYYSAAAANNVGNVLDSFSTVHPDQVLYGSKFYAGPVAGLTYDSRNSETLSDSGIYARLNVMGIQKLNAEKNFYGQFTIDADHYLSLIAGGSLVLANRIGAGTTAGKPDFFQHLYLGGTTNLRGFRGYRFAGKSFAYHNVELRVKLFDFASYLLPGTVGMTLFNDIGRVWQPGESSNKWHDGYGAGVYIRPAELALIQFQVAHSTEGWQRYIKLGFRF